MTPQKLPRVPCICPSCKKHFILTEAVFRQRSKGGTVIPSCTRKYARNHWQAVKEYAHLTRGMA